MNQAHMIWGPEPNTRGYLRTELGFDRAGARGRGEGRGLRRREHGSWIAACQPPRVYARMSPSAAGLAA